MNFYINGIDKDLQKFVYEYVKPHYDLTESGHNLSHIKNVIERSLKFAKQVKDLPINLNMVYTIAMFHDTGHHIDRKTHEILSSQILKDCKDLSRFFTKEQIEIMAQAVCEHRASSKSTPSTIYGKIVSTADRNNSVEQCFFRSYTTTKKLNPSHTEEQIYDECYAFLNNKFGFNGYSKFYFEDEEYENFLKEIRTLLANKEIFIRNHKNYIENLKKEGKIK